jgi:perosamine synthetase
MIPVFKPAMNKEKILAHLGHIFDSGWIGMGHVTEEFEQRIASFLNAEFSVFLNSGTSALHLAVEALQLPEDSIFVVPDITFVSTASVVLQAGYQLMLAPVDKDNICIDLDWLEKTMKHINVRGVIPVHYSGNCCNIDMLSDICRKNNAVFIEDCAHAMGSTYKGCPVGNFGEMGCFSFHAVKNLAIGDGGAVIGKERYESFLRKTRWLGIDKSTYQRTGDQYNFSYDINYLGYKYHGNDINAAIGLHNLELLKEHNLRRRQIFLRYAEKIPGIHIPDDNVESSHHLISMFIRNRNEFIDYMGSKGIAISAHYKPVSSFTLFSAAATEEVRKRGMEIFENIATLPCYPDMSDQEQDYIIEHTLKFIENKV